MKKKIIATTITISVIFFICIAVGAYMLLFSKPFRTEYPTYIYIDENDDIDSIYTKIERKLNPSTIKGIKFLSWLNNYSDNIHTGAYRLDSETRTIDAFRKLKSGSQTPVRLIVPSTRTVDKLIGRVSRQIMADSTDIMKLLNDSSYIANMGFNKNTLPALFIPNTYEVYWNMTAEGFIKRIKKEYDSFWNEERTAKANSLGLSKIEICTLASIVEEETANNGEKPLVAGLYINRLKRGIPLQADPTVKFSLQDFGLKRILFKHLEVESPYNTYKINGLPPGPIRIPSAIGLNSVLNYARHNYIYMCAKEDFSGTHNFASSLREHQINAYRYQQALNKRNIR